MASKQININKKEVKAMNNKLKYQYYNKMYKASKGTKMEQQYLEMCGITWEKAWQDMVNHCIETKGCDLCEYKI